MSAYAGDEEIRSLVACVVSEVGDACYVGESSGCLPWPSEAACYGDYWGCESGPLIVNSFAFVDSVRLVDGAHVGRACWSDGWDVAGVVPFVGE